MKYIEIKEGKEWGDTLFFDFVKEEGEDVWFRFFPRPWNGGDYLKGFAFTVQFNELNSWDEFVDKVVLNPEFIQLFWVKYRNGFHPEKYWFKLVAFFGPTFEGTAPEMPFMNTSGRMPLPKKVEKTLVSAGVKMEAW